MSNIDDDPRKDPGKGKPGEFKITINQKPYEWPTSIITGAEIKRLAGFTDAANYEIWQRLPGGKGEEVFDDTQVDLNKLGEEKFQVIKKTTTEGLNPQFLPVEDRDFLEDEGYSFEEAEENGLKVVILKDYPLPAGKFDVEKVDVLFNLPPGYPDQPPDMFFFLPWAKLANGSYPHRAEGAFPFKGESWQQWSRHSSDWIPGEDGIWTMIARMKHAIRNA